MFVKKLPLHWRGVGVRRLIANVLTLFHFFYSLPNYANVLFVLKIFKQKHCRCFVRQGVLNILIFQAQVFVVFIGVCPWFVLGQQAWQTQKGGGADQSRKVLCFVDFKLRQEKTFANKLARYLTKLRNLGRLGYAVGDLVILGYCFFFF